MNCGGHLRREGTSGRRWRGSHGRLLPRSRVARSKRLRPGIANIWVAVVGLVIIGMVGLGTDIGYVMLVGHQLQNAVDAASLAGAQLVRLDTAEARAAALNVAAANEAGRQPVLLVDNEANAPEGDVVIGRYDRAARVFTPTLRAPNAVKVLARRTSDSPGGPVGLFFSKLFGFETANLQRTAVAMVGGGTGAGLICLDHYKRNALSVSGTCTLDVEGGAIQVNSEDPQAVWVNGTPSILAPALNVKGDTRFVGGAEFDGDLNLGAPRLPDPLQDVPEPTWNPAADLGGVLITGGEHLSIQPGYYSAGLQMNNGSLTLAPGIYILDGIGLDITGGDLYANGVMFFIVDQPGVNDKLDSHVNLVGNGICEISPPDPDEYDYPDVDTYEGISFFQARDNTNEAVFVGTGLMDLEGTLYFPAANVDISGTNDGFGNQLIANTVEISGEGTIVINYDGRNPAPGNKVYLVE